MSLTMDQVMALAPDASSLAAAKKVSAPGTWSGLGRNPAAVWGECKGSATYQVRVDLRDLGTRCSCPSRKFPCKHALGLLLMVAGQPAVVPESSAPAWVEEWLAKRGQAAARKAQRQERAEAPADPEAQAERAERRLERITQGLEGLELWMCDLVRNGLAGLELQGPQPWLAQAARMVDAQAPGVAARLRRMAFIPGAGPDWPRRLLGELGRLELLAHAFRRRDSLAPGLASDVRQLLGWALPQEQVVASGDLVADDWLVWGQWTESEERLQVQRTWLCGLRGGRQALILQFSAVGAPYSEVLLPGTHLEAELAFWPSAWPQRALLRERRGNPTAWSGPLPGSPSTARYLEEVAQAMAHQPWLDHFPCLLRAVTPVVRDGEEEAWFVVDAEGRALPLRGRGHWRLHALSGGHPLDVAGEWDGESLLPLGASVEGTYEVLWGMDRWTR